MEQVSGLISDRCEFFYVKWEVNAMKKIFLKIKKSKLGLYYFNDFIDLQRVEFGCVNRSRNPWNEKWSQYIN